MFYLQKWQIVKYSTIVIAVAFSSILIANGLNEESFRIAIRFTARSSCLLFLLAFNASPLRRIKPTPLGNWLVANRRYLGLSMAISNGFHAIAIAGVATIASENMAQNNHGATLGYVFIILMTITSFDRPTAIIGRRSWKILHTIGMYYLWLSFTIAFSERLTEVPLVYLPFVSALAIALILRLRPRKITSSSG